MRNIIISDIFPPIPVRDFDFVAYFEDDEEGPRGFGSTEEEARAELLEIADE